MSEPKTEATAEEIVKHIKNGSPFSGGFDEWEGIEMIKEYAEAHTDQRLSELKENVEAFNEGGFISREFILQLIEEVCDE